MCQRPSRIRPAVWRGPRRVLQPVPLRLRDVAPSDSTAAVPRALPSTGTVVPQRWPRDVHRVRGGWWHRPGGSPGAQQAMGTGPRGHAHTCQLSVVICRGGVPAWAGTATVRERSGRSGVGGPRALAAPRAPCGGSWGVRTPDLGTAVGCAGQRREPVDDVMDAGPGGRGRRRQQPKAGSAACSPGPCPSRDRRGGHAHGGTPPGTEETEGAHASAWSTTWAASGPGARLRPTRGAAGPADASRSPGLSVQAQRPAVSPSPAHTVPLPRVLSRAAWWPRVSPGSRRQGQQPSTRRDSRCGSSEVCLPGAHGRGPQMKGHVTSDVQPRCVSVGSGPSPERRLVSMGCRYS